MAVLTHNRLRLRGELPFWTTVHRVFTDAATQPGFLAGLGFVEVLPPLLNTNTFTVWETIEHSNAFAYDTDLHNAVRRRARQSRWMSEFMFIRFHPVWSEGAWNGVDPLAAERPTS